jgi:CheY-like chemotaxis protein
MASHQYDYVAANESEHYDSGHLDWDIPRMSAARRAAYAGQTETPQPVVLIVDDDLSIAHLLMDLLESVGYRVFCASNGRNALTIARAIHPELVLTDYLMPELDGRQVIRALRANPATSDIPAVLMSSTRPREAALRDIPFLPKPFNLDEVLHVVERHVAEPLDSIGS